MNFVSKYLNLKNIPAALWVIFAVLILTAGLYIRVFANLMTNWDDEIYILNNPYIKQLTFENLKSIFSAYYAGNYHPLTLLVMALDYKMSGIHPWSYQLTNFILHICNTFMVYLFAKKLLSLHTENSDKLIIIPYITALLFGIHTLQVESVAWMSELKNLLYSFFFLVSLILYINYIKQTTSNSPLLRGQDWTPDRVYFKKPKISWYWLSLLAFTLSLLSKGQAVPLSLCVIAIDYFVGRNLLSRKIILEKIPFLLLSLVFGLIAILAQHTGGAIDDENRLSLFNQTAVAGYGFIQYLIKLLFPYHLSAFYPYPSKTGIFLPWVYYIYTGIAVLITIFILIFCRRHKTVIFGSLFFVFNISIVIQLLPVGDSVMADRYIYIPSIGFFLVFGYFLNYFWQKSKKLRLLVTSFLILYTLLLSYKTYHRVGIWKDSMTLWNDALKHNAVNNDRAHQNLANVYFDKGMYSVALEHYDKILQIRPVNKKSVSKAFIGKARIMQAQGDVNKAMEYFNTSLSYMHSYDAYLDRAVLKIETGDMNSALSDLEKASRLNPLGTGPYINKGGIYYQMGEYQEALMNFDKVHRLDPDNSKAYIGKGQVKQALNDMHGALKDFDLALSLDKSYEGYLNRAVLKIELKDFAGAQEDLSQAAEIDSLSAEVYINRGVIQLNTNNPSNALIEFSRAVEISPDNYLVYYYRAIAKYSLHDFPGAVSDLNFSIQYWPTAEALCYRGYAFMQLKNKENACKDFSQSAQMGNTVAAEEFNKNCK